MPLRFGRLVSASCVWAEALPDAWAVRELVSMLETVTDPRKRRGVRHRLAAILALAVFAVLAGAKTYREIGDRVADPRSWRSGVAAGRGSDEVAWAAVGTSGGASDVGVAVDAVEADRGVTQGSYDGGSGAGEDGIMIDLIDINRLRAVITFLRKNSTVGALGAVLGDHAVIDEFVRDCTFGHAGTLVFPDQESDVVEFLSDEGLAVGEAIPSVVVKHRLARRYGLKPDQLQVSIRTGRLTGTDAQPRQIEVFVLPGLTDRSVDSLAGRERAAEHETHLAFEMKQSGTERLRGIWDIAVSRYGMVADGGGYNPHEQVEMGGRSVFYFTTKAPDDRPGITVHRIEVACAGHYPALLNAHVRAVTPAQGTDPVAAGALASDASRRLIELVTGGWRAQAVHAAVRTGLIDAVDGAPRDAADLAEATGCHPDATARLLRYLASVDVLTVDVDGRYAGTSLSQLLRSGNPFRDLVELYGSEFYQAWGAFDHSARTGESAFSHVFGQEHFPYFRQHPELSRRFGRAMAAMATMIADRLAVAYDFSAVRRVVDIGGGDGTLMAGITRINTHLSGAVFDRPHVVADGPARHPELEFIAGDFFDEVPDGADVYLLARILHDWADEQCRTVLRLCRTAMRSGSRLLVVERTLPADQQPSLAGLWDLHMLAITGGRERTGTEYARLLADTGFALTGTRNLALGFDLLVADAI